jgi:hypothetical protein
MRRFLIIFEFTLPFMFRSYLGRTCVVFGSNKNQSRFYSTHQQFQVVLTSHESYIPTFCC